jgi:hypothetical protein
VRLAYDEQLHNRPAAVKIMRTGSCYTPSGQP